MKFSRLNPCVFKVVYNIPEHFYVRDNQLVHMDTEGLGDCEHSNQQSGVRLATTWSQYMYTLVPATTNNTLSRILPLRSMLLWLFQVIKYRADTKLNQWTSEWRI